MEEFGHDSRELPIEKVLAKAVALQLKPMNADISKFAFDHLLMLIDGQLNDMIGELHKLSNLQRRESIAKGDLQLFFKGFNLSPSDLDIQCQASQYIKSAFKQDYNALHSLKESSSDFVEEDGASSENIVTALVPPTNPLRSLVPKWLPDFPPDHTYKFTPQYNHPITDETIIRKKIVEEGKQSELALLHLLKSTDKSQANTKYGSQYDEELAKEETLAIYGRGYQKTKRSAISSSDLLARLPQTNFSIEEYAHNRVEIARRKVLEYEEKQLQLQKNPFLKLSRLVLTTSNDKLNKRQVNKEIRTSLKRSFFHLINTIPELKKAKQEARELAEKKRIERLIKMKALKDQKLKEKDSWDLGEGDINTLDLDDLGGGHHEAFFGSLDSSEDEDDATPGPAGLQEDKSILDSEAAGTVPNEELHTEDQQSQENSINSYDNVRMQDAERSTIVEQQE